MNIGDYARYKNTGTVGKVLEVKQEAGVEWILLDTFNLYYDSTTLEPGLEVEYKTSSVKESNRVACRKRQQTSSIDTTENGPADPRSCGRKLSRDPFAWDPTSGDAA
jgi:hypothetical protein